MEAVAPVFVSTTTIITLYFGTDLITGLDFEVFLTYSLVCLAFSSNWEKEKKEKLSG